MALAYVLGNVFLFTATLLFARSSDGRCSNRTVVRNRVGQGWESGEYRRQQEQGRYHRGQAIVTQYVVFALVNVPSNPPCR